MESYDFNDIDQYVESILKDNSIDKSIYETIDMEEIDKYVEQLLNEHNNIKLYAYENENPIEIKKDNINIRYNSYKKNNTTQCIIQ
jgi:endo-1,4-beta-mannosidase